MGDIRNKNELRRRIDLFLHEFTPEEYKINEEFCKETMRMMAEFIGHVDNRLDSANAKMIAGRKRENELVEYSSYEHERKEFNPEIYQKCEKYLKEKVKK